MIQAKSSNIVRHKPNYAILFCLLVVVGDLSLQIVPIRVKALHSDSDPGESKEVQKQSATNPKNDQIPKRIDPVTGKQLEENQMVELFTMLNQQKKILDNCYDIYLENRFSDLTDAKQQELVKLVKDAEKIRVDCDEKVNNFKVPGQIEEIRKQINSNLDKIKEKLSDKKQKSDQSIVPINNNDLVAWEDLRKENSNDNNINGKQKSGTKIVKDVPVDNELSISDSVRKPQPVPNGEQPTESVPEPIEHQLNESASKPKDDQIPPKEEPVKDKQFLQENQVFELTTMLCQQKKIIENCYKIYNEGSSSGLKYAKQQELKKLVEDAKKIQADCNEKVNEFELPEPVEKFREQINSNLGKIKGKLSDKTDLSAEYDQLEPAEMTVPIDYLERSKFWRFFSDHKKALIYGSIAVGVEGALAAAIGGDIYSYKNKKLSGHIPDLVIVVNERWTTKPNKSSFTKKSLVIVLMAIILAVVAFIVLNTTSKNSSVNKQQPPPQPQQNQPTETPTDTNNANTTTTGTENVDKTGTATGLTPTKTNKTNKSKQSARKSRLMTKSWASNEERRGEKSKAKSAIQPVKSKGSGIGGQRRRSQAQPRSSMVAKSVIQISKQIGKPTTTKTNH